MIQRWFKAHNIKTNKSEMVSDNIYGNYVLYSDHLAALTEKDKEIAALKEKTSATWCAYCGHRVEIDDNAASKISEHIQSCSLHPMRIWERHCKSLEEQNTALKAERDAHEKALNIEREEAERLKAENEWVKHLLRQIINDLPDKRDWLDPDIEREANKALKGGHMNLNPLNYAATTEKKVDFYQWKCLDCCWIGSRHETDSNFIFSVLCPKCGSNLVERTGSI